MVLDSEGERQRQEGKAESKEEKGKASTDYFYWLIVMIHIWSETVHKVTHMFDELCYSKWWTNPLQC